MNTFSHPSLRFFVILACFAAFAFSPGAAAEIYRCVVNGKTTISTDPCPLGAKAETVMPDTVGEEARAAAEKEAAWLKREAERLTAAQAQRDADEAAVRQAAAEAAAATAEAEAQQTIVEVHTGWPLLYYRPVWRHRPPAYHHRPPPARRRPPPPPRLAPGGAAFRPAPAAGRPSAIRTMSRPGGGVRGAPWGRGNGRFR
ncbi:MAG: DUF4124 domain-containing protein [Zoogloeaceae bacterium]|nr:DUF4124 domain-containing protein [Zoogloeaceae bacterium]